MVTFPIVTAAQRTVLGTAIAFAVLPVIAVTLRVLAQKRASRKLTLSDYLIIVAAVVEVGLESVSITAVLHGGIGWGHVVDVVATYGPEPITLLLKLLIPLQLLWVLSLTFCKVSILLLYSMVFPVSSVIWPARVSMVVIVLWAIATILAGFLICQPFARNWDQSLPGHCGNEVASFQATGVLNLLTDLSVLLLPMPHLYKLNLARYKRFTLIGIFSVGFMTCVVSGFRISVLSTMNYADITYTIPLANIFSGLEPSVAVTLACIPMLRPLFGRSSSPATTRVEFSGASRRPDENLKDFQPLDDDSSQYRLRPLATKQKGAVKVGSRDGKDASDADSDRSAGNPAPVPHELSIDS